MRVWTLRMTLWTWNQGSRPWKRGLEPEIERVATCLIHIIAFQQCVHLWSAALKDEAQEEPNFIKKCLMCTLRTATISIEPDWCISSTKNKVKYLTGFMVLLLSLSSPTYPHGFHISWRRNVVFVQDTSHGASAHLLLHQLQVKISTTLQKQSVQISARRKL